MIRTATRTDIRRITEIRFAVHENKLQHSSTAVLGTAVQLIDISMFWVWEEDGKIAAFSAADPRDGSIFALFVDPISEGRGIGRKLLTVACNSLGSVGHKAAILTTEAGTRAERLYRKDGWREIGRKPDGQIVFEKELG
jgi:GNAT superfamily N-acetyltransferase